MIEEEQLDTLRIGDSGSFNSTVRQRAFGEGTHIIEGLRMGGDVSIQGVMRPGGIVYGEIERVTISMGPGGNQITINGTHEGSTDYTCGSGQDTITIYETNGPVFIQGNEGDDVLSIFGQNGITSLTGMIGFDGGSQEEINNVGIDNAAAEEVQETVGLITPAFLSGFGWNPSKNAFHTVNLCTLDNQNATGTFFLRLVYNNIDYGWRFPTGINADVIATDIQNSLFPEASCGERKRSRCSPSIVARFVGCTLVLEFTGQLGGVNNFIDVSLRDVSQFDIRDTAYAPVVPVFKRDSGVFRDSATGATLSINEGVVSETIVSETLPPTFTLLRDPVQSDAKKAQMTLGLPAGHPFNLLKLTFHVIAEGTSESVTINGDTFFSDRSTKAVAIPVIPTLPKTVMVDVSDTALFVVDSIAFQTIISTVPGKVPDPASVMQRATLPESPCQDVDANPACGTFSQQISEDALSQLFPFNAWEWIFDTPISINPFQKFDLMLDTQPTENLVLQPSDSASGTLRFRIPKTSEAFLYESLRISYQECSTVTFALETELGVRLLDLTASVVGSRFQADIPLPLGGNANILVRLGACAQLRIFSIEFRQAASSVIDFQDTQCPIKDLVFNNGETLVRQISPIGRWSFSSTGPEMFRDLVVGCNASNGLSFSAWRQRAGTLSLDVSEFTHNFAKITYHNDFLPEDSTCELSILIEDTAGRKFTFLDRERPSESLRDKTIGVDMHQNVKYIHFVEVGECVFFIQQIEFLRVPSTDLFVAEPLNSTRMPPSAQFSDLQEGQNFFRMSVSPADCPIALEFVSSFCFVTSRFSLFLQDKSSSSASVFQGKRSPNGIPNEMIIAGSLPTEFSDLYVTLTSDFNETCFVSLTVERTATTLVGAENRDGCFGEVLLTETKEISEALDLLAPAGQWSLSAGSLLLDCGVVPIQDTLSFFTSGGLVGSAMSLDLRESIGYSPPTGVRFTYALRLEGGTAEECSLSALLISTESTVSVTLRRTLQETTPETFCTYSTKTIGAGDARSIEMVAFCDFTSTDGLDNRFHTFQLRASGNSGVRKCGMRIIDLQVDEGPVANSVTLADVSGLENYFRDALTTPVKPDPSSFRNFGLQYANVADLVLYLNDADNVVNVHGTSATTLVQFGAGDDSVFISSDAMLTGNEATEVPILGGTLEMFSEQLILDFGDGVHQLIASDASSRKPRDVTINRQEFHGLTDKGGIQYETTGSFRGLFCSLGEGGNTVSVESILPNTLTVINTGAGDDDVKTSMPRYWSTETFQSFAGALVVNLQDGDDKAVLGGDFPGYLTGGKGSDHIIAENNGATNVLFGDQGHFIFEGSLPGVDDVRVTRVGAAGLEDERVQDVLDAQVAVQHLAEARSFIDDDGQDSLNSNDRIIGGSGRDFIFGGIGDDFIHLGEERANVEVAFGDHGIIRFNEGPNSVITYIDTPLETGSYVGGNDQLFSSQPSSSTPETWYQILVGGPNRLATTNTMPDILDSHIELCNGLRSNNLNDSLSKLSSLEDFDLLCGSTGLDLIVGDNVRVELDINGTLLHILQNDASHQVFGGNDILVCDAGDDIAIGGVGDDMIFGDGGSDHLMGDNGEYDAFDQMLPFKTVLCQSPESDEQVRYQRQALSFKDHIFGADGDDFIFGGDSDDTIDGGAGENDMIGGFNVAWGCDGNDTIIGGPASDAILGDNGFILRHGQVCEGMHPWKYNCSWDRFQFPDQDVRRTFGQLDALDGRGGGDELWGHEGNDVIMGQTGDDEVYGGEGSDDISLGPGCDFGSGGPGLDTMCGERCSIVRRYQTNNLTQPALVNGSWARDIILENFVTLDNTLSLTGHVCAAYDDSALLMVSDFVLMSSRADDTEQQFLSTATELLGPGSVRLDDSMQVYNVHFDTAK